VPIAIKSTFITININKFQSKISARNTNRRIRPFLRDPMYPFPRIPPAPWKLFSLGLLHG
jgi:hypothetical protein